MMANRPESCQSLLQDASEVSGCSHLATRPAPENSSPGNPLRERIRLPLAIVCFGLLAGWLELGLTLVQKAIDAHVPTEILRTNRHFVWMIPVSDALIFAAISLAMAPLAWLRPGLARWLMFRLPLALMFTSLLLTVKGLHAVAQITLACGLAATCTRWLTRRPATVHRIIPLGIAIMAASLVPLSAYTYNRITSAEARALASLPPAKPSATNVLLIVLDDVRATSLRLYGNPRATTPNLERLVKKGLLFNEARATSSWTLPTHASLLTGRWPHELSVGWDLPLDGAFPTLAELLSRQGYATAGFVGNTFFCNALYGLDRGFARYEDAYENQTVSFFEIVRSSCLGFRAIQLLGYPTRVSEGKTWVRKSAEMLNRDVLNWLDERPSGQPFFAFLNYYDAHAPFEPPDGPDPRFGLAAAPPDTRREIEAKFLAMNEGRPAPVNDAASAQIVNDGLDLYRDLYESCIAYLDRQIGLLFQDLERRGLLENTLVILTSDHGEHFGEHGLVGHNISLYRSEVQVPLLLIPPARSWIPSAASVVNEPVSLREVPATVADWVGLNAPSPFPGRSLGRFLANGTDPEPAASPVLAEIQHMKQIPETPQIPASLGPLASLISKKHIYIQNHAGREELYDLANDPFETDDLASLPESRAVLEQFRDALRHLGATPHKNQE